MREAVPLLDNLPGVLASAVKDRGYSRYRIREHIWSIGAKPAIPAKADEAQVACLDGSTTATMSSSGSGLSLKSGEPLQHST
jgi:hypothetical protein